MNYETQIVQVGALSELCLFGVLVLKGQWKKFPLFVLYACWAFVSDSAILFFHINFNESLARYIIEFSLDSAFQALVLVELGWSVMKPIKASLPTKASVTAALLALMIGTGCWYLAGFTVPENLSAHGHLLVILQQTISFLRVIIFLFLVAFSQFFSIGWRDRELQIASGLGFYSILSLIVSVLHTHQAVGPQYHWLDLVTSFGYLGTLAYWVVAFAQKEPETRKISPQMIRFLVSIGGTVQADRIALEAVVKRKSGSHSR